MPGTDGIGGRRKSGKHKLREAAAPEKHAQLTQ